MKKALATILVLVMAISLIACGNGGSKESPVSQAPSPSAEGPKLAEHIEVMSNSVVPAVINAFNPSGMVAPAQWIYTLITDKLIEYDEAKGEVLPQLATRWETNDNKTIRFYLREDVYFHNGEHFTAEDVKWTIETSREFPGSGASDRWAVVTEANVIDTYTIDLVLERPNAGVFTMLAMPTAGIYNSKAFQEQPDNWFWVGTGPFIITDFSTNEFTAVTRNDNYWGGVAPTKTMTFRFVPEESVRTVMMLNNDFQFSLGIQADDLDLFYDNPEFVVTTRRMVAPLAVGFNMTDPLMADLNFRKAVFHAVDCYEIGVVSEGVNGVARMEDSNIWGDMAFRKGDIPLYERDLDLAKQFLEASSYNGERVEIAAPAPPFIRGAELMQEQLKQIGINAEVNAMDQPGLFSLLAFGNNKSQIHYFTPETSFDPFLFVRNNFMASPLNRTSCVSPEIEELLLKAEATTSMQEQRALFEQIQDLVAADPPWMPTVWRDFGDVGRASVSGFVPSGTSARQNFRQLSMLVEE